MATLAEIRAQHPEYGDLSDQQLADGLYKKFYSDMPRDQFDTKVGLKDSAPAAPPKETSTLDKIGAAIMGAGDLPIIGPAMKHTAAAGAAAILMPLTGESFSDLYNENLQSRDKVMKENPGYALAGNVAGNLAATGGAGMTATGARLLGITGENLAARAGMSALSSGGISAADTAIRGGSAQQALGSGAISAGLGGAIPFVGRGATALIDVAGDALRPAVNAALNPAREAARRVGVAVERDRAADPTLLMTPQDEAVARTANIPVLNVDRGGETTRALARSVANQSPEARAVIQRTADDRFAGQGDRAENFIRRLTGGNVDDLAAQDALDEAARAANGPTYRRAHNAPAAQAVWDQDLAQLMQAPAMQRAAMRATARGANRQAIEGNAPAVVNPFVRAPNGQMQLRVNPDGSRAVPNLAFWDQVARNLRGDIGKLQRAGDDEQAGDLIGLRRTLLANLDRRVPEFRQARQGAAGFFGQENALDAGRAFARSPRAIPETERAINAFNPAERRQFETGFASELIDKIRTVNDRSNAIRAVFHTPASRRSIEMAFGPQRARALEAYVRVEDIADRLRGAMGNSTTVRQLVELGLGAGGGYVATGGDWKGALAGAAVAKGSRWAGQSINNRVMQRMATMLTSDNPAAINGAVRIATTQPVYMRALEHLGNAIAAPARSGALFGPAATAAAGGQ